MTTIDHFLPRRSVQSPGAVPTPSRQPWRTHGHRPGIPVGDYRRVHHGESSIDPSGATLREHWHLRPSAVAALPAGWMSRAWAVRVGEEQYVARLVDDVARHPFEAGLAAALQLHDVGFTIGEPLRTLGGGLTAGARAGTVGVVRRVPGDLLDGRNPVDQRWWGERLAAAH